MQRVWRHVHDQHPSLYRQCLNDEGARAAAARQMKKDYVNNAQSPTGILGAGKPPKRTQ